MFISLQLVKVKTFSSVCLVTLAISQTKLAINSYGQSDRNVILNLVSVTHTIVVAIGNLH